MRQSGILLHLTSLPSPEGLGTLGAEARHFADFLKKAGMRVWQVLPISPTGYAESPYQCFSTYAGNPLLIDLRTLKRQGILKTAEPLELPGDPERADYAPVIAHNNRMLSQAFEQSYERLKDKVQQFREENAGWIEDFALFMWTVVDQLFREITDTPYEWPEPAWSTAQMMKLLTVDNVADAEAAHGYIAVPDYQEQYAANWGF